ncbi:MAG: VWA domain-containing protein [Gemmataceae bacterium]
MSAEYAGGRYGRGQGRWQSVAGCLVTGIAQETRGGHRVAVVVFAARPQLIVPLTTDYDHIRSKLSELNGRFPPATIRPDRDDFPSGTRIGAAIAFVVESLDQRFVEFRDVILLSDGDDPADDREWNVGVTAARKVNVPVHTVSLGDPDTGSLIPLGNAPLEFEAAGGVPDLVRTRAHEDVLKAIATEGRGQFLAARRRVPDLASFVRTVVDSNATRELTDDQIPQKKARFGWFYAFAVGMALLWWWRERT